MSTTTSARGAWLYTSAMPTFVALRYRAILPIPNTDALFELPDLPPAPALEGWEAAEDGAVPWSTSIRLEALPGVPRTVLWVEWVVRLGAADNPARAASLEVEQVLEQLGVKGRIVGRQTYSDAERLRPGVIQLRSVDPGEGPSAPGLDETDPRRLRDALDALARRLPHPRVLALLELANWVVNEEVERPCVPERVPLAPSLRAPLRVAEATLLQAAEGREPFETAWDLTPS